MPPTWTLLFMLTTSCHFSVINFKEYFIYTPIYTREHSIERVAPPHYIEIVTAMSSECVRCTSTAAELHSAGPLHVHVKPALAARRHLGPTGIQDVFRITSKM